MVVNTQTVGTVSASVSRQRTGTSRRHTGAKWALVVGLLLGVLGVAHAKTCVWTGAQDVDNFLYTSNPANWQDGQTPAEGDTVIISTTSEKTIIWTFAFPLENFIFTNTVGGAITAENSSYKIRVTGRASEMVSAQALFIYLPIEVDAGAQFALRSEKGGITFVGGRFLGAGEIHVTGKDSLALRSNPDFHGTWNIYAPVSVSPAMSLPFGADDCTVNVYGKNANEATRSGRLDFGGAADVAGTVNLFDSTSVNVNGTSSTADALVTFRGDVAYTASAGANTMFLTCSIANANRRSGYVFLGDCVCKPGNGSHLNINTYSLAGTYYLDFRGQFCQTTVDNEPPGVHLMADPGKVSEARAEVRLHGPISGAHSWKLVLRSRQEFHLLAADILSGGLLDIGRNGEIVSDALLDLHGHDQRITAITSEGIGTEVHDFVVTSSERPATLRVGNNEGLAHVMPRLNGLLSVYGYNIGANYGNAGLQFANEGDTSGWIGTEKNTLTFTSAAKYLNLGGIECTGAGSVVIESGATFNPGMSLDVHDVTGQGLRLATGANLTVKHAFVEGVDLPAGVYCRAGAGVTGATEVDWLNAGPNEAADATGGTVTVTDHDPVWIWTGKGSSASFADPANWGANAAPDLTNPKLTLNFKNAAGKSDVVVPLDGVVAPAGSVNCGDYSKGAVTFGGTGTLVLGGTDDALKAVFTEGASLTWNGTGTLRLAGQSTSTGTLTVKSGTVVLESASWTGAIIVAEGAELVVDATCGSEVFGPLAEGESVCTIALSGKLTLGDGVAAAAKGLFVDGQPIRHGTTYGSSASAAKRTDDAHFGGTGTIVSWTHGGTLLIIR